MSKTILITGSTDGIGLETAKMLYAMGHTVLLHGRNKDKLERAKAALLELDGSGRVESYQADLSKLAEVEQLASTILSAHEHLDVLINNAGIFVTNGTQTPDGFEVRFAVNAISPYYLTEKLLPIMNRNSRVVNLSSAAQATVDPEAIKNGFGLSDNAAYAQSKLLLTMWSRKLGLSLAETGPVVVSVNPKSFLGSKMVKEAYGVPGGDLQIGVDILVRASLAEEFESAFGLYFDNDIGQFSQPHPDALNEALVDNLVQLMDRYISESFAAKH